MIGIVSLSLLFPYGVLAQANFLFRNLDAGGAVRVDAPVFDSEGVPLAGGDYKAELWGAATPDSLAPLVAIDRGNARLFVPFLTHGYFIASGDGYLCALTVPPQGWAWLQVRAWDARLGATYEEVALRQLGGYGESPLFYAQGGDPYNQFPIPGRLVGLQSFSLRPVPEPSSWALLALGGLAVGRALRRQRNST